MEGYRVRLVIVTSERSRYPALSQRTSTSPYRSGTSSQAKCPAGRRSIVLLGNLSCKNSELAVGTRGSSRPHTIWAGV